MYDPVRCQFGCQKSPDRVSSRPTRSRRIDELLDEIAVLQQEVEKSPAETLQDAAVKLRRLSVYLEDREPVRLPAVA